MEKRVKMIHNLDELEENEEIELQLADQEILVDGKLNDRHDILFNKDMKKSFERDFYKKQIMLEEVGVVSFVESLCRKRQISDS